MQHTLTEAEGEEDVVVIVSFFSSIEEGEIVVLQNRGLRKINLEEIRLEIQGVEGRFAYKIIT